MKDKCETNGNGKVKTAVNAVEISNVKDDINDIKTNHLPHIYDRLSSLEVKIARWSGGMTIIVVLTSIILKLI